MASQHTLPPVPAKHSDFVKYVQSHPERPIPDLVQPYNEYDAVVRKIYAQEPEHPATAENLLNIVPLFDEDGTADLKIRARDFASESEDAKAKYLMPLKDEQRKPNGAPAVVSSLKQFQTNFNIFSESSLADLDWRNVVAAGSAVTTSLLPVPDEFNDSKRGLRQFYHEKFAPASDVDLFLYGLTEKQAIEKIKQIERCIKDSILTETSTIRTKHAITIVSQYPTRHVQIVLRLYKSVAEILTGFDVDCSCAAYDGHQVYVAPRALGAYLTQINRVDLTRRSPSYENRLSKYSHRGFEVFWPDLDRSRIDPTIFERSFTRTVGLARLLVLEKLPKSSDRDAYLAQRRIERGRPPNESFRYSRKLRGNIKEDWDDEVAEWVEEDEVSDYHTFTIPYGEKFHARKIEKLLYTKDLLLNAEWNKPKDREVNLHRHPAFFGDAVDVIHDCCGYCPKPSTPEEEEVAQEESKIYVSGEISFLHDNPGRQEIGSFNPITETDWTEMAYVGNTEGLCQAIVDHDLVSVKEWLAQDIDVNRRDHTGRTALHLAAMASSPEIVQHLVDNGARLIARVADGRTALHLAAARGSIEIVKILLTKSEENEEEEARKEEERREALKKKDTPDEDVEMDDAGELISNPSEDDDADDMSMATGSFVKIKNDETKSGEGSTVPEDANELEPDVYDINVLSWDTKTSPLHLAILKGHVDVVEELVTSFGADVLLPVKLLNSYNNSPRAAILTLVLALRLPIEQAKLMTVKLLQLGASPAQGDLNQKTPLHYLAASSHNELLDAYLQHDQPAVERAINYLAVSGSYYNLSVTSVLVAAISSKNVLQAMKLLDAGAKPAIAFDDYVNAADKADSVRGRSAEENKKSFNEKISQPVIEAVEKDLPVVALDLLKRGADPNTLTQEGHRVISDTYSRNNMRGASLLDYVQQKLVALRRYKGERSHAKEPTPLNPDDSAYLGPFVDGSYRMWVAKGRLDQERENLKEAQKVYQKVLEDEAKREGLEEKKAAVASLTQEFEQLEAYLLSQSAKTFEQMHPEIDHSHVNRRSRDYYSSNKPEPFRITFGFTAHNLTDEKKEGYIQLFEAAWSGDVDTIRALCLGMWGPDQKRPPLEIGVTDSRAFSPFTIAILRGHLAAAKAILAISLAQYKPDENKDNTRYRMQNDGSEDGDSCCSSEDSEDGADSIQLETHFVDSEFTVGDVGEVKTQVESKISPKTVLQGCCNIKLFLDKAQHPEHAISDLIQYATWKDDAELLVLLINLGQELASRSTSQSLYSIQESQFIYAINLGRLRCLEEMIRRTGAGLPLDMLAENSGVVVREKPKYYQGLSVHGKKRADWAAAGGGMQVVKATKLDSPLLLAAREGNLEAVEWFLGTAPGRYYLEFAKANRNDKRLKRLSMAEKGLEQTILGWLNAKRDLALHCAVLSRDTERSRRLVEYLVQNMAHCLEIKSADGYTPLALAFRRRRLEFAKILVKAGANQTVRDKEGRNVLHLLLCGIDNASEETIDDLQPMLDLVDRLLVPSLLTQRCSSDPGSLTPLAVAMPHSETDKALRVLRVILDFAEVTGQKHLELLDGSGNTPVHEAVKRRQPKMLKAFLGRRPDLLYRENATGSTPADLAEDSWISEATADPPAIPTPQNLSYYYNARNLRACCAVDDSPESFKKDAEGKTERAESTDQSVYDLCRSEAASGVGRKRKLVSLLDANEVAKRLATRKATSFSRRRFRRYNHNEDEPENGDEVSQWLYSR